MESIASKRQTASRKRKKKIKTQNTFSILSEIEFASPIYSFVQQKLKNEWRYFAAAAVDADVSYFYLHFDGGKMQ